ncbi:TMEM175 family protein [Streptomyces uncialis]|uniref:TMEM175 family protein n=1 Tax=Streptomyces uncialis TaxID=1048205 RepID=UPI003822BD36
MTDGAVRRTDGDGTGSGGAARSGPGDGDSSPARLVALSDGIYAIVMTLLVLDVRVPDRLPDDAFHEALAAQVPALGAYALSFVLLAGFWREQRSIFVRVGAVDPLLTHLTLIALGVTALLPFPTSLLAEYGGTEPSAVVLYAGIIVAMNLLHLAMFTAVWRRPRLQSRPVTDAEGRATAADLVATVAVFTATAPVAFLSPVVAMYLWLTLLPLKTVIGRHRRAVS